MKFRLLLFSLIICVVATSQKTEAYYDFFWNKCDAANASYYSTVEKTDSGWLRHDFYLSTQRLQMKALYEDPTCKIQNGNCFYYHSNGIPSVIGKYVHGNREGICVSYYFNGMMADSGMYRNGQVVDKAFKWHPNGIIADSLSRVDDSTCMEVGWFDDGSPSYGGYHVNGKMQSKWKYYHHNGQLSATVVYEKGNKVSAEYFDENGKKVMDTSMVEREATFKGGIPAWKKYLEKNLYWPPGLKFTTAGHVTVGVSFAIDENGKVIDAEIYMPFHEAFDKIALKIVKNSPPWIPAISNNRKIKAYRRQPITFTQEE